MIFFKHCLLPFHTSFKLSPQGLGVCPVWPRPPLHPPNTHPPVTGKGPSAIRSWCEATLYLSHFTTSLFITDRHKWTSPRGWCQCYPSVYPPPHTHWHPSLPPLPLFSLTSRAYCVTACLFFSTEVVATRAYKLSACAECRPQHGGRKYKSQSASAALFSCAVLYRCCLLRILCCSHARRFK